MTGDDSYANRLRSQLPEIGESLAVAFETISRSPSAPACEGLAIRCHGAARHLMALREALQDRGKGDER